MIFTGSEATDNVQLAGVEKSLALSFNPPSPLPSWAEDVFHVYVFCDRLIFIYCSQYSQPSAFNTSCHKSF